MRILLNHIKTVGVDDLCTACAALQYFLSFILLDIPFVFIKFFVHTELLLGSDFSLSLLLFSFFYQPGKAVNLTSAHSK